ncbi:DNA-directed RNA polymerase III subunit 1 [Turnera subulata]|uniref:DNA-directed RNA polymerase subunit n=1 Tax=Turnera subulata TaxID=218843 RepID=A0A9Q0JAR8_9ROSI|nr:DNA-directed RNA polymerase III subunit 1 [Turnera subulata]
MQKPKEEQGIVFTKQPYIEDVGPRKIKSIQFAMMSGPEIMRAAECQVHLGQYYDGAKNPIPGGLLDSRMGPAHKAGTCDTCGASFNDCPGHFGYTQLAAPVFNVGYLSFIVDILKCICKSCSRLLLDEKSSKDNLKKMRSPKMETLKKVELMKSIVKKCSTMASSRQIECKRCGYLNGMVKKAPAGQGIIHDRSKLGAGHLEEYKAAIAHTKEHRAPVGVATYLLNPVHVLLLFKCMTEEDCETLYLCDRPEKLIITTIPVPPLPIRPSVVMGGSLSNENEITERLKQIIQMNAALHSEMKEGIKGNKHLVTWENLQAVVSLYVNSDARVPNVNELQTRPLAGLVQRLKGKHGRFRGNLSGKRVEFTGRTVISPDPNLRITEVAIPIHMARILSYPECVTNQNLEKLRLCVSNGPHKYPGAQLVSNPDGSKHKLVGNYRKRLAEELKVGSTVHRHLEDGDVVLFNRQPSLHRMSIMSHRARIMPWRTLRFNESVCNPYNADFDGDEMNMHVPQTEEARTEALMLMGVQNNLCTPKNGEILVASTQDFLTSSFLITRKDTLYDRSAFSLMCSYMDNAMDPVDLPTPAILKPVELWTGKQLFSILLRPYASMRVYLNLTVKEKTYSKPNKGEKERETMCPNDGFVYFRNSELISGQLGKATLGNGNKDGLYSVLLRDYNTYAAATCMNRLAKLSARWIGNHGISIGIDDVQPGKTLIEKKGTTLSNGYQQCDKLIEEYNKGKLMLRPGCDAIQTLEAEITGKLNKLRDEAAEVCMKELHWRNSPLIMSQCGSKGSPINISQMIACVGQQSVAGHRAPDGFIDRSLPHFPRKSKTPAAKGFVANSFYTGLTATEFFFHTMAGREGLVDTAVKTADTGYLARRLMKGLEDLSIQYDNTVQAASGFVIQFRYGDDSLDPAKMEGKGGLPLNFDRLLMKVKATCAVGEDEYLSSSDIPRFVENFLENHSKDFDGFGSDAFKESLKSFLRGQAKRLDSVEGKNSGKIQVEGVSGNSLIRRKIAYKISGITEKQLRVFLKTCIDRYLQKRIDPGTSIGAIGAQSIAEPGTQMTLKTFHFAGVASMNITQGVPRIKEIINGAKKISTPIITAELEHNTNVNAARIVKGRIQKTLLGQVAKSIKISMSSRSACVVVTLNMGIIQEAQLGLNADIVKEAIDQTPRLKPRPKVNVLDADKLEVVPPGDRNKLHFELHWFANMLPNIVVKGIKTIERIVIAQKESKDNEKDQGCPTYNMLVEGTGLLAVMGTEGVDGRNTTTNHIMELLHTLGIEAARQCIIDQIRDVMEGHGMSIDIRHMMLLADVMTSKGDVLGITRFGIQKMDKSVLMLASFEKTSDHLFAASAHGRDDRIEGVSECIIMGIPMSMGTGILKIQQRVDPLPMLNYRSDPILS